MKGAFTKYKQTACTALPQFLAPLTPHQHEHLITLSNEKRKESLHYNAS